ncbi:MAG: UDP-3-O-acyl-N-acetylglucosamine deacetylase [Bacteriovoracia bacterium]
MTFQRTLAQKIKVTGIGLHSGRKITMNLHPAPADFGIQFKRTDLENADLLPATVENVGFTQNNTGLGKGENVVHTVEHLLSVLYGMGVNSVLCEIDGPEVPIMDGSGASLVFLLKEAGISSLHKYKKFLVILDTVRVEEEDKWAQIEPCSHLMIDSTITFAHPKINTQQKVFDFNCEAYLREVSRARTFGFTHQVDYLKRCGLIKGASLDNAVVLDEYQVINPEGLRFQDEFVRHKILDTVGDVSLLGYELAGKITTYKSGHHLHYLLCQKLLATPSAFEIVSSTNLQDDPEIVVDTSSVFSAATH